MGMDQWLSGHIFYKETDQRNLGLQVYEIGWWRKHGNLHQYICNHLNDGNPYIDSLTNGLFITLEFLEQLQEAVKAPELLPELQVDHHNLSTNDENQIKNDLEILGNAYSFLSQHNDDELYRQLYYKVIF